MPLYLSLLFLLIPAFIFSVPINIPTGRLLNSNQANQAKSALSNIQGGGFLSKKNSKLPVSLVKTPDGSIYGIQSKSKLGTGMFSKTRLAQNIETGEWVVLKKTDLTNKNTFEEFTKKMDMSLFREAEMLRDLGFARSPLMVRKEISGSSPQKKYYQFQKLIEGKTVKEAAKFSQDKALFLENVEKNALNVLKRLHDKGLAHGDPHAGNMMINDKGNIQLIDWGRTLKTKSSFGRNQDLEILYESLRDIAKKGHGLDKLETKYDNQFKYYHKLRKDAIKPTFTEVPKSSGNAPALLKELTVSLQKEQPKSNHLNTKNDEVGAGALAAGTVAALLLGSSLVTAEA